MSIAGNHRISEILAEVIDLPVFERDTRLNELCGADESLRTAVESLLMTCDDSGAFATGGAIRVLDKRNDIRSEADYEVPAALGSFEIVSELGRGGMGVVYEAWQQRPRRRVALKMLRADLASESARERFEAEAEWLGRLCHPGIAQVYEAGVLETEDGPYPYICMELVSGRAITKVAQQEKLSINERLALVARVCDAVQHAHIAGIVHRDLKPANILVATEEKAAAQAESNRTRLFPKVLDFGIACIVDAKETDSGNHDIGHLGGTVPYMAPEQLEINAPTPTAQTDVYALGVVLYELLTGRLPYDFSQGDIADAIHLIRHEEPTSATAVNRSLRGDVATIVATAIARDPSERYAAPAELAADIRRFLDHRPIVARQPGTLYVAAKFARRNRTLVGGIVAAFICLAAGLVATSYQAIRATRAESVAVFNRDRAEEALALSESQRLLADQQTRRAQSVAAFLTDTFGTLNPVDLGRDHAFDDMLDRASERLMDSLDEDPLVRAELHDRIGALYRELGETASAAPHIAATYVLYRDELGPNARETLDAMITLAESGPAAKEVGWNRWQVLDEAEAIATELYGTQDDLVLRAQRKRIHFYISAGRYTQALDMLDDYLADSPGTVDQQVYVLQSRGGIHEVQLRLPLAIADYEQALDLSLDHYADSPVTILRAHKLLANVLWKSGRYLQAELHFDAALDIANEAFGSDRPATLRLMFQLSRIAASQGDEATALEYFDRVLAGQEEVLGLGHHETQETMRKMAWSALRAHDLETVESLVDRMQQARADHWGPNTAFYDSPLHVRLALAHGRSDEARELVASAIDRAESGIGPEHPRTLWLHRQHALVELHLGNAALAADIAADIAQRCTEIKGSRESLRCSAQHVLGMAQAAQGQFDEAIQTHYQNWLDRCRMQGPRARQPRQSLGALITTILAKQRGTAKSFDIFGHSAI